MAVLEKDSLWVLEDEYPGGRTWRVVKVTKTRVFFRPAVTDTGAFQNKAGDTASRAIGRFLALYRYSGRAFDDAPTDAKLESHQLDLFP